MVSLLLVRGRKGGTCSGAPSSGLPYRKLFTPLPEHEDNFVTPLPEYEDDFIAPPPCFKNNFVAPPPASNKVSVLFCYVPA